MSSNVHNRTIPSHVWRASPPISFSPPCREAVALYPPEWSRDSGDPACDSGVSREAGLARENGRFEGQNWRFNMMDLITVYDLKAIQYDLIGLVEGKIRRILAPFNALLSFSPYVASRLQISLQDPSRKSGKLKIKPYHYESLWHCGSVNCDPPKLWNFPSWMEPGNAVSRLEDFTFKGDSAPMSPSKKLWRHFPHPWCRKVCVSADSKWLRIPFLDFWDLLGDLQPPQWRLKMKCITRPFASGLRKRSWICTAFSSQVTRNWRREVTWDPEAAVAWCQHPQVILKCVCHENFVPSWHRRFTDIGLNVDWIQATYGFQQIYGPGHWNKAHQALWKVIGISQS